MNEIPYWSPSADLQIEEMFLTFPVHGTRPSVIADAIRWLS